MRKERTSRKTLTQILIFVRTHARTNGWTDERPERRTLYTPQHTSYA